MKIVYIKNLPENKEKIKEFLEEVEIIKEVNHPNVLSLYEFAKNDVSYQIVMEYIGES